MTESKSNQGGGARRAGLFGLIGVLIVLGITIAVNVLANGLNFRADLTEDKIYTLSEGTRSILSEIDTPVTVRFYVSEDARSLPQEFKNLSRRVEDFLLEYREASGKMISVEKYNVKQDTDEEDAAALDGIRPAGGMFGQDPVYFGIAVNCLDQKVAIPYVPARPEELLEYDLTRAITQVVSPEKPSIAVMTSMRVGGGFDPSNFQAGPQPAWVFFSELSRDYDVAVMEPNARKIVVGTESEGEGYQVEEKAPDVLVVLHPHDITAEGQYAIDQYLLNGGKVMALVDPLFFTSRFLPQPAPQNPMMGGPPPAPVGTVSHLDVLLPAWGVEFDPGKVVADKVYRTPIRGGIEAPTVLSLSGDAINREDPVTAQLNDVSMLFAGGFVYDEPEGVTAEVLLQSSPQNMLILGSEAEPNQGNMQKLENDFAPSGVTRAFALRLSGNFATAFPDGNPSVDEESADDATEPAEEKEGEEAKEEEAADESLKKSVAPGAVVLFADADFIYDQFMVQVQNMLGQRIMVPLNGNLPLVQNTIELLAGDTDLINVRSRASTRRPFTKINEMQLDAEEKFSATVRELEQDVEETQLRLNQLQTQKDDSQKFVLSPEQQQEIEEMNQRVAEKRGELREVRKDLRRDIDSMISGIKWLNILGVPVLVILIGVLLAVVRRTRRAAR